MSRLSLLALFSTAAVACIVTALPMRDAAASGVQPPDSSGVSYYSYFEGWEAQTYALDPLPRWMDPSTKLECDAEGMVLYRSQGLRYAARAHPAFAERLARFDAFVASLATDVYGRAPRRLIHRGAFACRSTRARRERISEHAYGNAIDFQGLDFAPLPRKVRAPDAMPKAMRQGFQLRVSQHWSPRRERDGYHAAFLHRLAEELRAHPEIFRGIVGPPRPRHHDHLHLDAAPWRYAMFGYDRIDATPR